MPWWGWTIAIAGAYMAGSIPFGVIIARLRGVDIRQHGSRNIGATNVSRVIGRRAGGLCFALDVLKGAIPVGATGVVSGLVTSVPAQMSQGDMWLWLAVAAAAIAGHMYSIFLRFGGGKGIATGFGTLLAMWPLLTGPAVVAFIVWYTVLRLVKYVSVASMAAGMSIPFAAALWNLPRDGDLAMVWHIHPVLVTTAALALVIVWKHRANIARIRRGEEPKSGVSSRKDGGDTPG